MSLHIFIARISLHCRLRVQCIENGRLRNDPGLMVKDGVFKFHPLLATAGI